MDTAQKELFAKCWKSEYKATVKVNELHRKIEVAQLSGRPTTRLENSLELWTKKQEIACDPLIELIRNGSINEDAPKLCDELLGSLIGYVSDCYYCLYQDFKPEDLS